MYINEESKNIEKPDEITKDSPVIKTSSDKQITNETHMDKEVKPIISPYEKKK